MDLRKHILEAITLIAAAFVCAIVANAVASRERKMALVGTYPNALKVPVETSTAPLPSVAVPAPEASTSTTTASVAVPSSPSAPVTMTIAPANTTTAATHAAAKSAAPTTSTAPAPAAAGGAPKAATASPADILKRFPAHPDKPYIEIGYADAAALYQAGALFLDARRTSMFEQGHIAGARPYSVWESDIDEKTRKLFDERSDPQQQALPIVAYCTGGECEDSHTLAQKLWGIQFNNVYVYKDGFPDWQKHGGAVRTGTNP